MENPIQELNASPELGLSGEKEKLHLGKERKCERGILQACSQLEKLIV